MSARLDGDALADVVDARSEQQIPAAGQLAVDRVHGVRRLRHEEVAERDRASGRHALVPGDAARVPLRRRHPDVVVAAGVDEQVRLLTAERRRVEGRVRRVGERSVRGRPHDAREDLVPHGVRPASDLAVADQPLLLRAVDDEGELRVGDEAAARELRPGRAVVHERDVGARDVETPHRGGLGDGPEVRRCTTAVLTGCVDVQGEVRKRAPEVDEGVAVARAPALETAVVHLDLAVDRHVSRRRAQAGDLGVVAHLQLQGLRRTAVDTRFEQKRIAVCPHLGVDLLRMDRVEGRLDLADRHARVEDDHVRP